MGHAVHLRSRSVGRRVGAAALLVIASLGGSRPAAAELFIAGTCTVALKAKYSPAATLIPDEPVSIDLSDAGGSSCFTTAGVAAVDVSGTLATPPTTGSWSCVSGLATGRLTVRLDNPDFPDPTVDAAIVNVGGTMHLVMTSDNPIVFDGVATLVQDPLKTAECLTAGPISGASWFGSMTFQDPVVPAR